MNKNPPSLALFRKFAQHFGKVGLLPVGFNADILGAGRFFLQIGSLGDINLKDPIRLRHLYVDTRLARIDFRTDHKARRGIAPHVTQNEAAWKKIGPVLKRRRIIMSPRGIEDWHTVGLTDESKFTPLFKVWRPMRGFVHEPRAASDREYLHWSKFVPPNTPEHMAILSAMSVEQFEKEKVKPKPGHLAPSDEMIHRAKEELKQRLELVPA